MRATIDAVRHAVARASGSHLLPSRRRIPVEGVRPLTGEGSQFDAHPPAFGSFQVENPVGAGRFGPVYRAVDPVTAVPVIVRTFAVPFTDEELRIFLDELAALCETPLDHPSIAQPMAHGVQDGVPYLVHARLAGTPADQILAANGPQRLVDLIVTLTGAAAAIDFASATGVRHGVLGLADLIVGADLGGVSGFGIMDALRAAGVDQPATAAEDDVRALAMATLELMLGAVPEESDLRTALARCEGIDVAKAVAVFESSPASALAFAAALQGAIVDTADDIVAPVPPVTPTLPFDAPETTDLVTMDSAPVADVDITTEPPGTWDVAIRSDTVPTDALRAEALEIHPREAAAIVPLDAPAPSLRSFEAASPQPPRVPITWLVAAAALIVAIVVGFAGGFSVGRNDTATVGTSGSSGAARGGAPSSPQTFSENVIGDEPRGRASSSASASAPSTPVASGASAPATTGQAPAAAAAVPTPAVPATASAGSPAPNRGAARDALPLTATTAAREAVASAAAEAAPTTGRMLVHSVPSGARVLIDGQPRGDTPAVIRELPFGSHVIDVLAPGFAPWRRQVVLNASRPAQALEADLASGDAASVPRAVSSLGSAPGALQIDSRPSGAQVFIDGRLIGRTPVLVPGLDAGAHDVRIEAPGYRAWTTSVPVAPGSRARVAASLEQ